MERLETAFKFVFTAAIFGIVVGTLLLISGFAIGNQSLVDLGGWFFLPGMGLCVIALCLIAALFVWFG